MLLERMWPSLQAATCEAVLFTANTSQTQNKYVEDAGKMMHRHNLPLDYPEFVRAKINAKNASDVSKTI